MLSETKRQCVNGRQACAKAATPNGWRATLFETLLSGSSKGQDGFRPIKLHRNNFHAPGQVLLEVDKQAMVAP